MHPRTHIVLAAAALLSLAGSAQACPRHATQAQVTATAPAPPSARAALVAWKPRAWAPASSATVVSNGLWVSRDPVDGTLGMPDAATLASRAVIATEAEAPVLEQHFADGSVSAKLDDRWANFAVVRIGADGKPAWTCVSGRQGAAQFLAHPVIVPAPSTVERVEK